MRLFAACLLGLTALSQPNYPVIRVTGEPPLWRLEPLAVITAPDGVGFSRIGGLLVDRRGDVVVVDAKERRIYRYDGQGKSLGTVGRVGSGPGEFRVPYAVAALGDALMAYDPMNSRISWWDRSGTFVGQMPDNSRLSGDLSAFAGAGGTVWLEQRGLGPSGKRQPNFVRITPTGPRDTVWLPYVAPVPPSTEPPKGRDGYVACVHGDSFSWFNSPFSVGINKRVITLDGRVLAANGFEYRLTVMSASGDTLKALEHTITRAPISDAEWRAGLTEYEAFLKETRGASCTGRQVRPKAKPAIRDLATDATGRVWVERHLPQGYQWEAWQGDKLVGGFVMPDSAQNVRTAFGADRVAFARYRDDDGGYEVRLFRLRK